MPRFERESLGVIEINTENLTRESRYDSLCTMIQGCRACPTMEGRKRVLSASNGNPNSPIMFIAEAPGRNGADRTGIPMFGDPTGNAFGEMLKSVGWTREEVFTTNAVLCNPRSDEGNNRAPLEFELENCSHHLESQIRLINPKVIATFGERALDGLSRIHPHTMVLRHSVGQPHKWMNYLVFPLYHPSPRSLVHRGKAKQMQDFSNLAMVVNNIKEYNNAQV